MVKQWGLVTLTVGCLLHDYKLPIQFSELAQESKGYRSTYYQILYTLNSFIQNCFFQNNMKVVETNLSLVKVWFIRYFFLKYMITNLLSMWWASSAGHILVITVSALSSASSFKLTLHGFRFNLTTLCTSAWLWCRCERKNSSGSDHVVIEQGYYKRNLSYIANN